MTKELSGTITKKDDFEVVDKFSNENELDWKKLIGYTTDGAPSVLEYKSGFKSYVNAVSPNAIMFTVAIIDLRFAQR